MPSHVNIKFHQCNVCESQNWYGLALRKRWCIKINQKKRKIISIVGKHNNVVRHTRCERCILITIFVYAMANVLFFSIIFIRVTNTLTFVQCN